MIKDANNMDAIALSIQLQDQATQQRVETEQRKQTRKEQWIKIDQSLKHLIHKKNIIQKDIEFWMTTTAKERKNVQKRLTHPDYVEISEIGTRPN